jgi:hypothetical protein
LDLNGDTIVDYAFQNHFLPSPGGGVKDERVLDLVLQGTNQAVDSGGNPAALGANVELPGSLSFDTTNGFMAGAKGNDANGDPGPFTGKTSENWSGASNAFLGLRFDIGGQTHYGWARLSVSNSNDVATAATATLHDWAYESTSNASLLTGQTADVAAAVPEPNTLILLAAGAAAVGAYRSLRRKQAGDVASDPQSF